MLTSLQNDLHNVLWGGGGTGDNDVFSSLTNLILAKIQDTVQSLEKYSFVDGKNSLSGKDILGDFFEGIIRDGFKQSKGQFFTHINIVKFMLWAIQADRLAIKNINAQGEIPYMIDPSAGRRNWKNHFCLAIRKTLKTYLLKDITNY